MILAPKVSKIEWTRELDTAATAFAGLVERDAKNIWHNQKPRRQCMRKVFEDDVLDIPLGLLGPDHVQTSPLGPMMQRTSYWTESSLRTHEERQTYQRAFKALLVCGQTDALYYLVHSARDRIGQTSGGTVRGEHTGWQSLIGEMLEITIALTILNCFPEALSLEIAVDRWVPFIFARRNDTLNIATTTERVRAVLDNQGHMDALDYNDQVVFQCYTALCLIQAVTVASDLEAIDWKRQFADAFLHFVGFECWNRKREGQSYLACNLNTRRDVAWLQKAAGPRIVPGPDSKDALVRKPKDPLFLLEPRDERHPGDLDEANDHSDDLIDVEADEAAYGLRRSTKYYRKIRST